MPLVIPILYEDAPYINKRTAFSTRGFRQRVGEASRREASRSLLASRREEKNAKGQRKQQRISKKIWRTLTKKCYKQ
ncbi:hypothetical protein H6H03_12170 [Nostoc paludosum FACHB-159]|uniref:Uncharacterized protein n=1 Tax=Nostoc paludosum FACHB-159 TaxID=2692908 RepID=A0ABR8K6U7_9NOSO|nr:hypothetical protein [Nostoc paludosum FACHB-159]